MFPHDEIQVIHFQQDTTEVILYSLIKAYQEAHGMILCQY
jgi:hypothetical protein